MASPIGSTTLTLNNGHNMPVLGLGTWKSKPGEVKAAVEAAIDCGYRHLDCAYIYQNEKEVGEALKKKFAEGLKRNDIFITSKLWSTKHEAADVLPALKESLRDLQLDYLDLYLIHQPIAFKAGDVLWPVGANGIVETTDVHYKESWVELEKAVDEGLVRSIGLSNFNSKQITDVYETARIKPAVLQCESHPYFTQVPLIKFCKEKNIVFTAYSPLASPDRPFAKPDDPSLLQDSKLLDIGKKFNKSPAQICIKFQIQRGVIVIPKSVNPKRIKENCEMFDFELSEEDMKTIESFNRGWRACFTTMKHADGTVGHMLKDHYLFPYNEPF